jgi:hypothetical protein|tara:strand:- start:79 stop:252 length:174 start_codon:yes stop_codon:yes gene_type:complete
MAAEEDLRRFYQATPDMAGGPEEQNLLAREEALGVLRVFWETWFQLVFDRVVYRKCE